MNKRNLTKQKGTGGITLIALVITIIVLLILAGVSIAMLTGENGILTQASNAKRENEIAEAKEQAKLDIMAWRAEKIGNGEDATLDESTVKTIITGKDYVETLGETSFTTENGYEITYSELYSSKKPTTGDEIVTEAPTSARVEKNTKYQDASSGNKIAVIPCGFAVVPGCTTIDEGLVISDVANDSEDVGNQFVWIPVTSEDDYVRNTDYANISVSTKAYTDNGYLPEGIQPTIEASITDVEEIGLINEEAERDAVVDAGGFYIGRYEAGDESLEDHKASATDGEGTLVSKKNTYAYSYISQEDAKEKAKDFIDNDNVKSALISGIQWDVTMATINGKLDGNSQIYDVTTGSDTEQSDRHTGSKAQTGQNIADKVYNIYDLEGNFIEYVAEKNAYLPSIPCVRRGGVYDVSNPASRRDYVNGHANGWSVIRLALYVM